MVEMTLLELLELGVLSRLDLHEMIVRVRKRTDQFVELELDRRLLATLRVLNREHHHGGNRRADGCKGGFPSAGKTGQCQAGTKHDDDAEDDHGAAQLRHTRARTLDDRRPDPSTLWLNRVAR